MPTEKSSADLQTDNNNVITTATAPDAITPPADGALRANVIVSMFNKVDGAIVGLHGRDLTVPALFTPTVNPNGQTFEQVLQALLDAANAQQILITGGVQGLPGEFLAIITPETNQVINAIFDTSITPATDYRNANTIKLPNDSDNGGFDNGNNWLVFRYTQPAATPNSVFRAANLFFKVLDSNLTSGRIRTFQLRWYNVTTNVLLGSSSEVPVEVTDIGSIFSFNDFGTGTVSAAAGNEMRLELYEKQSSGAIEFVKIQFLTGFVYNEII